MTGKVRCKGKTDPYYTHSETYDLVGVEDSPIRVFTTECEESGESYLMAPSAFELVSGPEGFTLPDDPPGVRENPEYYDFLL